MTKFDKSKFQTSGEYLFYIDEVEGIQGTPTHKDGPLTRHFIARFKHKGPFTKAKFLKELIANHTVEGYLTEMVSGKAPLQILRDANEGWYYGTLEAFSGKSFR